VWKVNYWIILGLFDFRMFISQGIQFFIVWWEQPVETSPAEVAPDFAHKPCKDYRETVIGETQKGEEDGLEPCNFSAPCIRKYLQGPHTPFLVGTSVGQSTNLGHEPVDEGGNFVVPLDEKIRPIPGIEMS
jgi:hypothetical protein